ncbi:MAG TPA: M56 family metallopeptidase [Candidatus Acidoferrales bacterium]|nr:M56 family metallopeptidase [Candidatus Acidoferrales bacterium]
MLTALVHIGPALENHLWQSTAFAAAAWLLAFALRKNQAGTRYWIWLAASMKFMLPFSLLFVIGSYLRPAHVVVITPEPVSAAIQQITQPFSDVTPPIQYAAPVAPQNSNILPLGLFAIWSFGLLAIGLSWWRRWFRVREACATATPSCLGGTATLDCVPSSVSVRFSKSLLEPGVFGIFRPVLMLPDRIADRLSPAQMNSILAHEMSHIRRRDNLTATLHMFVEAVFWFHPIVWWIGTRLVEERENACDEEVMRLGGEPETYAKGILEVCKFYTESPVVCVSGVSGADLKKRIVRIMTGQFAEKLTTGARLLLGLAAIAAVAMPLAFGAIAAPHYAVFKRVGVLYLHQGGPAYGGDPLHSSAPDEDGKPLPSFEVASIKPGDPAERSRGFGSPDPSQFRVINMTARGMVEFVYGLKDFQLRGGPDWANSKIYTINAKVEDSIAKSMQGASRQERQRQQRMMLHSLLNERFKLSVSHVTKDEAEYALVVAKGGSKLTPTTWVAPAPGAPGAQALPGKGPHLLLNNGNISAVNQPVSGLADLLAFMPEIEGHLVVDHTGITGNYDYNVTFSSQALDQKFAQEAGAPPPVELNDSGPSIFTALEEQLGLKLEMTRGPVDIYTIEHIEEPSAN